MLSGVLRCGKCRKAYVGTAAHGRKDRCRHYVCSARYRHGTQFCDGDRLPKESLEEAVIEQMSELLRDTDLVEEALALSRAEETASSEESSERLAAIRQDVVGARRALDRYFAAVEEGTLGDCQQRIARLRGRIESLEARGASAPGNGL